MRETAETKLRQRAMRILDRHDWRESPRGMLADQRQPLDRNLTFLLRAQSFHHSSTTLSRSRRSRQYDV